MLPAVLQATPDCGAAPAIEAVIAFRRLADWMRERWAELVLLLSGLDDSLAS